VNEWNAAAYAVNSRFVSDLGAPLLELLGDCDGEDVLDLGCGDGALTVRIGGRVVGMDHSQSMVDSARALGVDARLADMHSFALTERFDAVFTNAVLHWTHDIGAVVDRVREHLVPGGRFVGEFGGFGNVAAISTAMRSLTGSRFGWYYATVAEFAKVLEARGFAVVSMELIPRPTPLPTGMRGWLETFARPFVSGLDRSEQDRILDSAVELLRPALCDSEGNWTADYVRLRFVARG
jgi:trans-aconitate methyltransferase